MHDQLPDLEVSVYNNLSLDIACSRMEELDRVASSRDRLMALELQRRHKSRRRRWRFQHTTADAAVSSSMDAA
jgi:hypothetical protein